MIELNAQFIAEAFIAIFAIVDPVAVIPFFTTLTDGYSAQEKKHVIIKCTLVALATLLIFGLVGQYIFLMFQITIPAFQIAGGILLLKVAFDMLHGEKSKTRITDQDKEEALEREAIGIVPLGIPLLAGPGAITTVMIYISKEDVGPTDKVFVFIAILVTAILTFILLSYADKIFSKTGRTGALAISRVMGVILAAISIQFIINGIYAVLLGWGVL